MSEQQFAGKVVLVTGASRGIGQAIASVLAQQGAYVVGTATTEANVAALQDYFETNTISGEAVLLNLSQAESIDALLQNLADSNKMPNILVNNAGVTADDLLLRMSDEAWDRVIDTNLTGIFRLTRGCVKAMFRARYGRIINISSIVALMGNAGQANYCAAKAGVIAFGKALALEVASRGITVNAVAPGFIDTDMTKALSDFVKEEMAKRIPMKRFGTAADVAEVVRFLASDGAAYITGETIQVNGGMYMS